MNCYKCWCEVPTWYARGPFGGFYFRKKLEIVQHNKLDMKNKKLIDLLKRCQPFIGKETTLGNFEQIEELHFEINRLNRVTNQRRNNELRLRPSERQ